MTTRDEHLAWCKERAIEILAGGDQAGAVASMISDLGKWEEPLYGPETMRTLAAAGMLFCQTPQQVRHWIEGFG